MPEKKIYIVTGAIGTGKTTRLNDWAENRSDVSGILTPLINDKRFFMNVKSGETFQMESDNNDEPTLNIGRYKFSTAAFQKANGILKNASEENSGWLIIDEIGPLELQGKGFCETLKSILNKKSLKVILVIRDTVLIEELKYFGIGNYEIFNFEY